MRIELGHVSKVYPGSKSPAVDDVSLDTPAGENVIFVGPSGCGKTTTVRMINRRTTLFIDGANDVEQLWIWLNEKSLPFQIHYWDGVFASAVEAKPFLGEKGACSFDDVHGHVLARRDVATS